MGGLQECFAGRNGEPSNSVVWRELAQAEAMPSASIGINQPPRSVRWNFPSTMPANTTAYNHPSMEPRDTEPSRPLQPRPGGHTTNPLSQSTRNHENVPSRLVDSASQARSYAPRRDRPPHLPQHDRPDRVQEGRTRLQPDPSSGDSEGSSDKPRRGRGFGPEKRQTNVRSYQGSNPPPDLCAYGQSVPTIKTEMKPGDIPSWDGDPDTAITYFTGLQEIATMGGYMPRAVAFWASSCFKEKSSVANWYLALDPNLKANMKQNCAAFIETVCTYYLRDSWVQRINQEFAQQSFRQKDHSRESPEDFVSRRAILSRMLDYATPGSKEEANLILRNVPVQWRAILAVDSRYRTQQRCNCGYQNTEKLWRMALRAAQTTSNMLQSRIYKL